MKKILYITGIVLILASAVSCKKDDGPVVDEGLQITAVKTRCDGTYEYLLKSAAAEKISTSEGSYYFYNWEFCEALKDKLDRLSCGCPAVYGESYTKLVIKANKAVTAKVVSTNDSPVCAEVVPADDGKSFEVKYKSGAEGNGAVYILVQSTDGASSKLISVGAYKTLPQIMSNFPTLMYYEVWDSTGTKMLSEQSISAIDNDSTSMFSIDSGCIMKFKGIWHKYVNDYDVHNYYLASWTDGDTTTLEYKGHLINIDAAEFKGEWPGYVSVSISCYTVNSTPGSIKPQYFNWTIKGKK